jgi:hypothetical protein
MTRSKRQIDRVCYRQRRANVIAGKRRSRQADARRL